MDAKTKPQELARKLREGQTDAWRRLRAIIDEYLTRPGWPLRAWEREEVLCDTLSRVWQALARLRDDTKLLRFVRRISVRTRKEFTLQEALARRHAARGARRDPYEDPSDGHAEAEELRSALLDALEGGEARLFHLLYEAGAEREEVLQELRFSEAKYRRKKHELHQRLRTAVLRYQAGYTPPVRRRRERGRLGGPRLDSEGWDGNLESL